MHLERESISLQSGDPELPKTHPLYRLATAASDVSPPDWLQLIGPYDATGEAETKGWKVTQHLCINMFTIWTFIMKECWILSKDFSASSEMIM
ncbi:hypothetical protein H671_1g3017 [Cricetulus griseus]|uniref:Uncharacterized protein n=1 Tax=Cricetulus griseus TaxID=10029 RepID=A0A061IP69_CRIGR|nr:hypothetical protein H671_1g3017 [Cricetulus griseus]